MERELGGRAGEGETLLIDAEVSPEELSDPAYMEFLDLLAPFGPGYEAPVFSLSGFSVLNSAVVGRNHLKLRIETCTDGGRAGGGCRRVFDVLGWSHGERIGLPWEMCDIAVEPSVNIWNGARTIQFILRDARKRG
jgi:single-stranded DNA-specific DHH superfamily exonuclease